MNEKYNYVEEIFDDPSIRAIGVIADVNQGKSNVIYHCITQLTNKYEDSIWSYGLHLDIPGMLKINSINEMEQVRDSLIFIDEFPTLFRLSNRRQVEKFEETMRKVFHHTSNNTVVIAGLPHNFNKFLSALLQVVVFKACTLDDFIQRSPVQQAVASFSPSGMKRVDKGSTMLDMPRDVALIYNRTRTPRWSEVTVPYHPEFDSKALLCNPIRRLRVQSLDEAPAYTVP